MADKVCEKLSNLMASKDELLGQGSFARVIARGGTAVKVYDDPVGENCVREITIIRMARKHKNIVQASCMWHDTHIELVMPRAHRTLLEYTGTPQPACVLEQWYSDIMQGVTHLHGLGVLHRDIKPGNILLYKPDGTLKLADFGSSVVLYTNTQKLRCNVTTLSYSAPELLTGVRYGSASDVWAVGITMSVVCLSRNIFRHETSSETLEDIMANLTRVKAEIDQHTGVWLDHLQVNPLDRPQTGFRPHRFVIRNPVSWPDDHRPDAYLDVMADRCALTEEARRVSGCVLDAYIMQKRAKDPDFSYEDRLPNLAAAAVSCACKAMDEYCEASVADMVDAVGGQPDDSTADEIDIVKNVLLLDAISGSVLPPSKKRRFVTQ